MKITKSQDILSKFLISRSLFLGGGVSLILTAGKKDAWIGIILGFFLGIGILYLYSKISNNIYPNLKEYLKKKTFLNILIRLSLLLLYLFLIFLLIIILSTFIYSYYLPFTKAIVSIFPFCLLAIFLGTKGTKSIARVGQALFGIGIVIFIIKTGTLFTYMKVDNFLPILTIKNADIFLTAIYYAVLTTTPYFLVIDEQSNLKNNLIAYTLSFVTLIIMFIYIIGCFGSNLVMTFSYPEFTILRLINFFNFIQNIESFLAINWLFDIFIALAYASKKLKDTIQYKNNIFTYIIVLALLFIVGNFIISDYKMTITIYKIFIYVFLILEVINFGLIGLKQLIDKKKSS